MDLNGLPKLDKPDFPIRTTVLLVGPLHGLCSSEDFIDVMKTDCTDTRRLQTIVFFCKMFPVFHLNWHHSVRVSEGNLLLWSLTYYYQLS